MGIFFSGELIPLQNQKKHVGLNEKWSRYQGLNPAGWIGTRGRQSLQPSDVHPNATKIPD